MLTKSELFGTLVRGHQGYDKIWIISLKPKISINFLFGTWNLFVVILGNHDAVNNYAFFLLVLCLSAYRMSTFQNFPGPNLCSWSVDVYNRKLKEWINKNGLKFIFYSCNIKINCYKKYTGMRYRVESNKVYRNREEESM